MITTPTVSGKPGQAPTGLSCDLYPLIGSHSTWTDPRGPVMWTIEVDRLARFSREMCLTSTPTGKQSPTRRHCTWVFSVMNHLNATTPQDESPRLLCACG